MWNYIVIDDTNFPINTLEEIIDAEFVLAKSNLEKVMVYRLPEDPAKGGSFEDSIALGFYVYNYCYTFKGAKTYNEENE